MKLTDLKPKFIYYDNALSYTMDEPVGVTFDCPKCIGENRHRVFVYFATLDEVGKPLSFTRKVGLRDEPVWARSGNGFHDMTLRPSVVAWRRTPPPTREAMIQCWHGFITNGEVTDV